MKLLLGLFLLLLSPLLSGHTLAPALLQIDAGAEDGYAVLWRIDVRSPLRPPDWPADCQVGEMDLSRKGTALDHRFDLRCPAGLAGSALHIDGLRQARTTALLRYREDGREFQRLLNAERPSVSIPLSLQGPGLWLQYLGLGVEHILGGADHLLLVLGVFLLCPAWRSLLATITGFTLGHSLTLSAASLDGLSVPSALVEFAIGLSLFWLALDLAAGRAGPRRRWPLFTGFGLIHGLGFAGALRELGLPAQQQLGALLSFNLGIELGQVLVLAGLLAGRAVLLRLPHTWPALWRQLTIYSLGGLAGYWCLERGAQLLA